MAAALVTKFLVEAGAKVTCIEPPGGDPFSELYPAYEIWRRALLIDAESSGSHERIRELVAEADICVLGGDDHPGLDDWRHDAAEFQALNPRLVILDIEGYPSQTEDAGRPATEILVQARSGLAYEHYSDRPLLMSFQPSTYGAALQGLAGLYSALYEREYSGLGQIVSTSQFEGALMWASILWCEGSKPTPAFDFVLPKDPCPLIFKCADGKYVQVVLGSAGSKGRLYKILGIDDPDVDINDSGMPKPSADARNFFGDVDLLESYIGRWQSDELLNAIWDAGLPAEPVLPPGGCWDDEQVQHNGIIVQEPDGTHHVGHPVVAQMSPADANAPRAAGPYPLSGITVIDFGAFVAGPYSSIVLGDLGADVIKVEAIGGDPNRSVFRAFTSVNRGKRTISLDLKANEGRTIAQELCKRADIVTSNFRTGVLARLGLDASTLHAMKPELIILESAAYGASGPKAERAGFDMVFQALCGHGHRGGGAGNRPLWNRTSMVDYTGGLLGAIAILQHLYQRARTGHGAQLSVGLLNAGIYLLSELVRLPDGRLVGAPVLNREQTGYHPAEQIYQADGGWIAVAVRDADSGRRLIEVLDLGQAVKRPATQWDETEAAAIAAAIRKQPCAELLSSLERAGVWVEECRRDVEHMVLNDRHLVSAGTIYCSEHPEFGRLREIGPLFRLSRSQRAGRGHAPLCGEHTRVLLSELGYDAAAIDDLYERKIVA